MLLANRYGDRTHFIFELLQNAEDALARRKGWHGSRAISFTLSAAELRVTHHGQPFDGRDVRGICGIGENTKDLTAIGRFGIGFKSVYAFTYRPEVHSGEEDFAIENFVWPTAIPWFDRQADETVFVLPLQVGDGAAHAEIAEGLRRLGPRTLLFLRQIEEISWNVEGGPSGLYVRGKPEVISENMHRIILLGEEHGKADVEETWIRFSREAETPDGTLASHIEIAFSMSCTDVVDQYSVQPISDSPLVVFFPTVVPTHLGFLVQGPYRTTPSRDNVPRNDPWNLHLVQETSALLVEALRLLRAHGLLNVDVLRSLPLDRAKFGEGNMFAPVFTATREELRTEPLLPAYGGGHVAASSAKIARTQELRELFGPSQLASIFSAEAEVFWLSGDITENRTPELRRYLLQELGVHEVTPETIIALLEKPFLEAQPDAWILRLYQFLNDQPSLKRRLEDLPLIRLEDGSHVSARLDGQPQAFLPGLIASGFPTVRAAVCETEIACDFLRSLGLTEPDPVDDVVRHVLPRYSGNIADVSDTDYEADIGRILTAFATDSKMQREKLIAALRETAFVRVLDTGDGSKRISKPDEAYLATDRLKELFAGVGGVLLVDDVYSCLRGEDMRSLLEACGATRYLQPVRVEPTFTWRERQGMRSVAGCESSSAGETINDNTLRGLDTLLDSLPKLTPETRTQKAVALWDSLGDLEDRRGTSVFSGTYSWFYYHGRSTTFDAAFVRILNTTAWVSGSEGGLQLPEFVLFSTLGWKANPFLLSKIRFKSPIIDRLAQEAGIEPGVLDLLKKLGVTCEADLRDRLGLKDEPTSAGDGSGNNVEDALKNLLGKAPAPTPPVPNPSEPDPSGTLDDHTGSGPGRHSMGGRGGQPFISYVATQPDEETSDPDRLDQQARMALETKAINLILAREPKWQRTHANNPGYDLFERGEDATLTRWCEVKAMTGNLHDRPVGLSHTQFECAQEHGIAYWLYVVEHAGEDCARIVRIQDPAGKARTFTFDHGWLEVAEVDPESKERED